jgi:hypothetical protein
MENNTCVTKNTADAAVTPAFLYGCDNLSYDQTKCYKCINATHYLKLNGVATKCEVRTTTGYTNCQ